MADRARRWGATINRNVSVVVRNYIDDLTPGENVNDEPLTVEVGWDQWISTDQATGKPWCEVTYGLTVDGRPSVEVAPDRQAMQRLRAKAQADLDWAALLRILRRIASDL